jgi:hypothetical protein
VSLPAEGRARDAARAPAAASASRPPIDDVDVARRL